MFRFTLIILGEIFNLVLPWKNVLIFHIRTNLGVVPQLQLFLVCVDGAVLVIFTQAWKNMNR